MKIQTGDFHRCGCVQWTTVLSRSSAVKQRRRASQPALPEERVSVRNDGPINKGACSSTKVHSS